MIPFYADSDGVSSCDFIWKGAYYGRSVVIIRGDKCLS